MSKEYWEHCFECAVENLAEEHNIDGEEAEKMLFYLLDENPNYLDGYITYD
jgi:hypothetical protein